MRPPDLDRSAELLADRRPEPELMDETDQAEAYAAADFSAPHQAFVTALTDRLTDLRRSGRFDVLDLGCGTADVTVRVARAFPSCRVVGIDGAAEMLAHGHRRVRLARLTRRVVLEQVRLPDRGWYDPRFDVIVANSLLHHLADPLELWRAAKACLRPGGAVFVMDLRRPVDVAEVEHLVERHAAGESELLRRDFRASLMAAYRPAEVREQLDAVALDLTVEEWGDRHLLIWGRP